MHTMRTMSKAASGLLFGIANFAAPSHSLETRVPVVYVGDGGAGLTTRGHSNAPRMCPVDSGVWHNRQNLFRLRI